MSKVLEDYSREEAKRLYPTSKPRDGKRGITEISKADYLAGEKQDIYELGFDAAIALELPVKFAIWTTLDCYKVKYGPGNLYHLRTDIGGKYYSIKDLFPYWIENIFKIE